MSLSVVVKTVDRRAFRLDVDPSTTILQLKVKLQEEQDIDAAALLWKGTRLSDIETLAGLNLVEGDFLVAFVDRAKARSPLCVRPSVASAETATSTRKEQNQPAKQSVDAPAASSFKSNSSSTDSSQPTTLWLRGDLVECLWKDGQWHRAVIVGADETQGGYVVRWAVKEELYTRGVSPEHIREWADSTAPQLEDLQAAASDPMFQGFLESQEFKEALRPLQELVRSDSEQVPSMVAAMHQEHPAQLQLMLPFLISELETVNPRVLGEVMGMLKAEVTSAVSE